MTGARELRDAAVQFLDERSPLRGWRRWLTAFLLGAITVAAQPPLHVLPVLIIGFSGLILLMGSATRPGRAFLDGWMFGTGFFAASLYWISNAFLVDAARFGWMIPLALLTLSAGLGLFGGVTTLLARVCWANPVMRPFVLAVCWTVFEWTRGILFTGFPWNPVGNVWVAVLPVLQGASWVGVYGLSFMTVLAAASFASLVLPGPHPWRPALIGMILLSLVAGAGLVRMAAPQDRFVDGVRLRVVQPHIPQAKKWQPDKRMAILGILHSLSTEQGEQPLTHVIWPESALPFPTPVKVADRPFLRAVVPDHGFLMTGSLRVKSEGGRITQAWNSLIVIDDRGHIAASYDKARLVPFGEYVPFRSWLPIDRLTAGSVDFSPGPGPRTLAQPGFPSFSPLICYEIIFPGAVAERRSRPRWLLNITNDGWFGLSSGPYQHFASARMRAVEEGLPLVRAANTGISAVVDPYGRVLQSLPLGESGFFDAPLPLTAESPTLYSRFGDPLAILPGLLTFACLAGLGWLTGSSGQRRLLSREAAGRKLL